MDISSAVFDPELGSTSFTVERITYTRGREGTASRSVTEQARGCVHPGTAEALKLLPEGERQEACIVIYTDYPLSTGTPESSGVSFIGADKVYWGGKTWRVVRVRDWQMFGYYQAYAVRLKGEGE